MRLPKINNRLSVKAYWITSLIIVIGLGLVYQATLAPGLTWRNDGSDGGDLTTAAAVAGVAHPGGYPTYLILARLWLTLPFGTLAYRTTLLSVASAIFAAVLATFIVERTSVSRRSLATVSGLVAAFGFGLAPLLWSQAVITEVYALHTLFITSLTFISIAIISVSPAQRLWLGRLGSCLLGLALGNQLTTLLFLPAWFGVLYWSEQKFRPRLWLESLVCLAGGLLVYIYVPLQASQHPPINWGNASTLEGFWWLVSGQGYRGLVFGLPTDLIVTRLQAWAGISIAQLSWPGLMVALYGFLFGQTTSTFPKILTLWLVVAYSLFAIGYGTSDSAAYLLPAVLAVAIWFGWGIAAGLENLSGRWLGLRPVALGLIFVVLFANAVRHLPEVDASQDSSADDYAQAVLSQAPAQAILITSKDRDTFSLWYYHYALHQRPDVILLAEPLLQFQWYRDNLRYTYPDLALPTDPQFLADAVVALNQRPACRTQLESATPLDCSQAP